MIITLANQKGGTGKTTICTNLAFELAKRVGQEQVLVVDADPQASIIRWSDRRNSETFPLPFDLIGLPSTNVHSTIWSKYKNKYKYILIDTPARITDIPRSCTYAADLVMAVTRASAFDVDSLKETVQLIEEAKIYRPEIEAVCLINDKDSRTIHSFESILPEIQETGLTVLQSVITTKDIFAACLIEGLTVFEYVKEDSSHSQIKLLADEILSYERNNKKAKERSY